MVKLKFKNSFGEVCFEPGCWQLTEADGLGLPTCQINAARYVNQPGQETVYCMDNPRTITLSGDINSAISGKEEFTRACGIFSETGVLIVETEFFKRQIDARCIDLVPGNRNGPYRSFVVQFLCDSPFFEDCDITEKVIYERIPLLTKDTILPAVLSERISKGNVFYPGSAVCEPTIYVNVPSGSGGLSISNLTTGGRISLSYDAGMFERLVIDVKNRTVTDENGVSRLDFLTDDSFFDGFYLRLGYNRIEAINSDVSRNIDARMSYRVCYREAIV